MAAPLIPPSPGPRPPTPDPRPTAHGRFVVLEGLDGSGTTTQVELLARGLRRQGLTVKTTREPTDGPIGRLIRKFLTGEVMLGPASVALAFAADRLEHIERKVAPALAAGNVVISDRYVLSSLAYQVIDLDPAWVQTINRLARVPDLTIFLDVTPAVCLARIVRRGGTREFYERRDRLERVARAYQRAIDAVRLDGERVDLIDGERSVVAVQRAVRRAVHRVIDD